MSVSILTGDALATLQTLPDESVHCIVTSPPYYGLRDYGVAGQIGLEPTPDEFIARLVAVFREARRVLRKDGTAWVNMGDSYANDGKWGGKHVTALHGDSSVGRERKFTGLKPKDLMGIPWRLAFALQADGWVLRQEIVWSKPNPMPESVTDRCTKAHEQIFLFAKARWSGPQPSRFDHISDQDARWLALLVDAEGCIVVKRNRHQGRADTYAPQVSIGNTSEALMREVVRIVGHGNLLERAGKNCRMLYWQLANGLARDFLHRIYPFLIVKQRQARIGIQVDSLTYFRGGKLPERKQRTEAENAILESLWARNKQCNRFVTPDLSDVPEPARGRWVDCERYYYDNEAIKEARSGDEDANGFRGGAYIEGATDNDSMGKRATVGNVRVPGKTNGPMKSVGHLPGNKSHKGTTAYLEGDERLRTKAGLVDYAKRQRSKRDSFKRDDSKRAEVIPGQSAGTHRPDRDESEYDLGTRNKRSVWTVATMPFKEAHFATFPPKLIEPCIKAGCPVGGTVLDPFGGAGTTGLVADRLQRNAILIELNPKYAAMARARIAADAPLFHQAEPSATATMAAE